MAISKTHFTLNLYNYACADPNSDRLKKRYILNHNKSSNFNKPIKDGKIIFA